MIFKSFVSMGPNTFNSRVIVMEIKGAGNFELDAEFGWYVSEPIPIRVLRNQDCIISIEGYDGDRNPEEFQTAIENFLSLDESALHQVTSHVVRYFQECNDEWEPDDPEYITLTSPGDVWKHVQLGCHPHLSRRHRKDESIYVSVECNCDWEVEHGLQIVFQNGEKVTKIGPFDGHLTYADAYDKDELEGMIYP